jgi:hypothetical protein
MYIRDSRLYYYFIGTYEAMKPEYNGPSVRVGKKIKKVYLFKALHSDDAHDKFVHFCDRQFPDVSNYTTYVELQPKPSPVFLGDDGFRDITNATCNTNSQNSVSLWAREL